MVRSSDGDGKFFRRIGVFSDKCRQCDWDKSCLDGKVMQFEKRILISPVTIDNNDDRRCAMSLDKLKARSHRPREAACINGHPDNRQIAMTFLRCLHPIIRVRQIKNPDAL